MKVSCQSCGAQYNLPDDKVRGRKAKVRCKKCSAQIIVDGTTVGDEDDDEATRVMMSPALSANGEPVWTVNLSDEEQLDMTEAEVLDGWRSGRVTDDAYVWREGMDEWLPILESSLGPAVQALKAKSVAVNPEPSPAAPVVAAPAAAGLGSAPKASLGSSFKAGAGLGSSPKAAGLGSSPLAAAKPVSSPIASPTPPPAAAEVSRGSVPSPAPKAKAQRSDDTSKAFSFALSGAGSAASSTKKASRPPGMAAGGLFGGPSAPTPAPPAASASSAASNAASSENSVMFSLDALKAAAAVEPKRSSVRAVAAGDSRVNEDILTLGGPSRFEDSAMPLIDIEVPPPAPKVNTAVAAAPLAAPPQKKSSWGLILIGVLAVGGMAGAYILGQQGKESAPVVAQNESTDVAAGSRRGADVAEPQASATSEQAVTSAAVVASATSTSSANVDPTPAAGGKVNTGGGGNAKPAGGGDKPADPPKTDKPAASPSPAPAPKPAGGPPFNVAAAKSALSSAAANAAGCRAPAGPNGTGKVQVTFAPSGNVTSALIVSGPFGGTPVGSCVARTFRAAKVPAFDGSPMTVAKSFTIN